MFFAGIAELIDKVSPTGAPALGRPSLYISGEAMMLADTLATG